VADFGRDPRSTESWRARRNLGLSGNHRTILPISRRPNFMKFEHNTSIGGTMNPFGTEVLKFSREGSFFQETQKK